MKHSKLWGVVVFMALVVTVLPLPVRADPTPCSDYVSSWQYDEPWVGTLIGTKSVTVRGGVGSTFIEEQFEVGTYLGQDGQRHVLRCDTYEHYILA